MKKLDLKKGDIVTLAIEKGSNASRGLNMSLANIDEWTVSAEVITVGRKYITVQLDNSWKEQKKFEIDNNYREKSECSNDYRLFTSKDEVIRDRKSEMLCFEISKIFGNWRRPDLSLETLEAIKELIDNEIK